MRLRKGDIGKLCILRFQDHTENEGGQLDTPRCCGWLHGFDKDTIHLAGWECRKPDPKNETHWGIIRATVKDLRVVTATEKR